MSHEPAIKVSVNESARKNDYALSTNVREQLICAKLLNLRRDLRKPPSLFIFLFLYYFKLITKKPHHVFAFHSKFANFHLEGEFFSPLLIRIFNYKVVWLRVLLIFFPSF